MIRVLTEAGFCLIWAETSFPFKMDKNQCIATAVECIIKGEINGLDRVINHYNQ